MVKWFLITGCFNDRKKGFHFSLFQFDTLHKLCDVPHHSFNIKKYLTILNHFFTRWVPHLNSFKVSQPPNATVALPNTRGLRLSAGLQNGPNIPVWPQEPPIWKTEWRLIADFKDSLVSIHATRGIPNLLLPCYTCRWWAAPLAIASSSRLEKQVLN